MVVSGLFLIVSGLAVLIFYVGWSMGEKHYSSQIAAALKVGNSFEASKHLHEWQASEDVSKKPFYFLALGIVLLRNGNVNAANEAMNMVVALMEK